MPDDNKPFSQSYVVRTTLRNINKQIDLSIRKTIERINEFKGDQSKSEEIFITIAKLNTIRKQINALQLDGMVNK